MKKQYVRPALLYEDFVLMDAITANCSPNTRVNYADGDACYLPGGEYFPENVFASNVNCEVHSIEFYEGVGFILFAS